LNGKKGVRPRIREAILELAKEMDYFPHSSAKALVQNRVGVIGVVIPRTSEFAFQNPYYSHMLLGLSTVASENDYRLMLALNEKTSHAALYQRRLVDGLVVVGNRIDDQYIPELIEKHIPMVAVPGYPPGMMSQVPSVNTENFQSVYRGTSYLISIGHRKIAFILGRMTSKYSTERLEAYKKALHDKGVPFSAQYIVESDFSRTDAFKLMGHLLDLDDPPSAVICINDSVTPGALHQIYSRKLKVPQDISVMAIGCSDHLELLQPPLTTVRTRVIEVGQTAARMLIQIIETGSCPENQVVIPSDLIIRESTDAYQG
jgi:LacI family transcriptional regulator